jgi:Peptidase A4 family
MGADKCADKPFDSSWWVGFDGAFNGDVLQAGAAMTACTATYVVWYEWFESGCTSSSATLPCYQTNLSLAVHPGNYLAVEVWYTTAAPNGHAYVLNYTTGKSVSVGFNQPSGTATYQGTSVEWIAERPGLVTSSGTTLTNLANYVALGSDVDYAYDGTHYYYPSSAPSGDTIYDITMTCPPWNPSSACTSTTGISWPYIPGGWAMWTFDEGPAYLP